jgi:hypothetical protein
MTWVDDHLAVVSALVDAVAAGITAATSDVVAGFDTPPEVRGLPAVYAAPELGDWADRRHIGACPETRWELRLVVPRFESAAGIRLLLLAYDVATEVARDLLPDALHIGALGGPIVDDVTAGGPALVSSVPFTVT